MRVLYVNVLPYGAHPGIDALAHGLDHRLRQSGIELRTLTTDVRSHRLGRKASCGNPARH